jgi:hypothetical protein
VVPLHSTATDALGRYAAERDRLYRWPPSGAFFPSSVGTTLTRSGVDKTFKEMTIGIGVRAATERPAQLRFGAGQLARAPVLQTYSTDRLIGQHAVSPNMILAFAIINSGGRWPWSRCRLRRWLGH